MDRDGLITADYVRSLSSIDNRVLKDIDNTIISVSEMGNNTLYFDIWGEENANRYAKSLRERGFDVDINVNEPDDDYCPYELVIRWI